MSLSFQSDSRDLLILAIVLAVFFAQDQDESTLGRMAAFFTILGDTLALFALQPGLFQRCRSLCEAASVDPDISKLTPEEPNQPAK